MHSDSSNTNPLLANKARYFVLMYVPVLIFCVLTFYGLFRRDYIEIVDSISDEESEFVEESGRALQSALALVESDILALSRAQELIEFVSSNAQPTPALTDLLAARQLYDDLLLIDRDGVTRVQRGDNGADNIINPAAPNRAQLEIVQRTLPLPEGAVYVSDIDLRTIDGELVEPPVPVIRVAAPIFDRQHQNWGVVVASINLTGILEGIENASSTRIGESWLVNRDGYWLAGPNPDDKWGGFYPDRQTANVATRYPVFWEAISNSQRGNLAIDGSLFAFMRICADLICQNVGSGPNTSGFPPDQFAPDAYWIIAAHIPASELSLLSVLLPEYERWLVIALALLALIIPSTFVIWKLASTLVTLRSKEQQLQRSMIMHEAFFERNPTIMFVKDLEGNYYMANKSCRNFADSEESLIGTNRHQLFPAEAAAIMDEQDEKVLEYRQPMEFNTKWKGKHGYQYFSTLRFPMIDNKGDIIGIGGIANDITDQIQARKALRESETQFRTLLETAPVAVILTNIKGRISLVNKRAETLFGYARRELLGKLLTDLLPEIDLESFAEIHRQHGDDGNERHHAMAIYAHDKHGNTHPVEVSLSTTDTEMGIAVTCLVQDVSDRAQLEAQLRQSQKMEAIGKLSGGMAHDFNNLLGVIIGNLDLAARKLDMDSPGFKRLTTAKKAAERGAELTKRMLAVARRQTLQPKPTDINSMILELSEILPRTLGPDIEMGHDLTEGLPPVLVDPSGLENVLINLALNSRDAMPKGGKFYITTHEWHLSADDSLTMHDDMKPGDYVHVAVTDNGEGMNAETLSRAFEPFFTTKERGKGTGLGLAMIYGFAKQSGGNVRMYSEPGVGTTIDLFLPIARNAVAAQPEQQDDRSAESFKIGNSEKLLVVDDEYELLEVAVAYLEEMGFKVLAATNGEQALRTLARNPDIDLLLTDIVMPGGINGVELAKSVRQINPQVKVLYTSGFPEGVIADKSGAKLDAPLVSKPYSREGLAKAISNMLAVEA